MGKISVAPAEINPTKIGPAEIWLADCLDVAEQYPDDHFQLMLTSTPYPGLAGFDKTSVEYWFWWNKRLNAWLPKIHHETGVIVQVIKYGRTRDGQYDLGIFDIPAMYQMKGMYCIDVFPWDKTNTPPSGGLNRHDRDAYEFCFAFGRSANYTHNKLRKPYARTTVIKAKSGNYRQADIRGGMAGGHNNLHPEGATLDNVLRISPTGGKEKGRRRVAGGVFPMELADRFILEFSNVQDRMIDPFCGSGTVLARSLVHGRAPVGVDIDELAVDTAAAWCQEVLEEPRQLSMM